MRICVVCACVRARMYLCICMFINMCNCLCVFMSGWTMWASLSSSVRLFYCMVLAGWGAVQLSCNCSLAWSIPSVDGNCFAVKLTPGTTGFLMCFFCCSALVSQGSQSAQNDLHYGLGSIQKWKTPFCPEVKIYTVGRPRNSISQESMYKGLKQRE